MLDRFLKTGMAENIGAVEINLKMNKYINYKVL